MISVSQCPKCELLFAIRNQLEDHLLHDHPDFQHVYQPSSARDELAAVAAAGSKLKHVLVVANQTLGSDNLLDVIKSRVAAGPCDFSIVLPSAKASGKSFDAAGGRVNGEDSATADQRRLDDGERRFHGVGATVDGRIGDTDPVAAVSAALSGHTFDEVIVSTFPRGASHWWRQDVATRIQRRCHLPVTVISAEGHYSPA